MFLVPPNIWWPWLYCKQLQCNKRTKKIEIVCVATLNRSSSSCVCVYATAHCRRPMPICAIYAWMHACEMKPKEREQVTHLEPDHIREVLFLVWPSKTDLQNIIVAPKCNSEWQFFPLIHLMRVCVHVIKLSRIERTGVVVVVGGRKIYDINVHAQRIPVWLPVIDDGNMCVIDVGCTGSEFGGDEYTVSQHSRSGNSLDDTEQMQCMATTM